MSVSVAYRFLSIGPKIFPVFYHYIDISIFFNRPCLHTVGFYNDVCLQDINRRAVYTLTKLPPPVRGASRRIHPHRLYFEIPMSLQRLAACHSDNSFCFFSSFNPYLPVCLVFENSTLYYNNTHACFMKIVWIIRRAVRNLLASRLNTRINRIARQTRAVITTR